MKSDAKNYLRLWARWIKKTERATYALGLPSMSIEQSAGVGRGQGQKPLPDWSVEMETDRIVNNLPDNLKRVVFAAHKIPVTLEECRSMDIAICCMSRYKDSQNCYTWPSNLADARKALGVGRRAFDGLYYYILGRMEEKLNKKEKIVA